MILFNIPMKIGKSLRAFRKSKKLGQADIAAIVESSITSVSDWERERCNPELSKLLILAKELNVSLDSIVFFNEKNEDQPTKNEMELIRKYRKAPLNLKESVNLILK